MSKVVEIENEAMQRRRNIIQFLDWVKERIGRGEKFNFAAVAENGDAVGQFVLYRNERDSHSVIELIGMLESMKLDLHASLSREFVSGPEDLEE